MIAKYLGDSETEQKLGNKTRRSRQCGASCRDPNSSLPLSLVLRFTLLGSHSFFTGVFSPLTRLQTAAWIRQKLHEEEEG